MNTEEIEREANSLVRCYRERVLENKTRKVALLGRKCEPQIMYTFLGFEVKLGPKRLTCPDMTTARFLCIFGKLGMNSIEIPYDPTITASVLPLLEESLQRIDSLLESGELESSRLKRRAREAYGKIRKRLRET
ncbi:MAG: hypothetical protein ACWGQW_08755 [bacterium]